MSKKQKNNHQRRGAGLAIGLAIGVMFAVATGNNGLFVIGIAIGAALEAKPGK
jgi:hypothetical protein